MRRSSSTRFSHSRGSSIIIDIRDVTLLSRKGCEALKKAADIVHDDPEGGVAMGGVMVVYPAQSRVEKALGRTGTFYYPGIYSTDLDYPRPAAE